MKTISGKKRYLLNRRIGRNPLPSLEFLAAPCICPGCARRQINLNGPASRIRNRNYQDIGPEEILPFSTDFPSDSHDLELWLLLIQL